MTSAQLRPCAKRRYRTPHRQLIVPVSGWHDRCHSVLLHHSARLPMKGLDTFWNTNTHNGRRKLEWIKSLGERMDFLPSFFHHAHSFICVTGGSKAHSRLCVLLWDFKAYADIQNHLQSQKNRRATVELILSWFCVFVCQSSLMWVQLTLCFFSVPVSERCMFL